VPRSLRLLLAPLPTPSPGGTRAVTGVRIALERRGKGKTTASADASVPAQVEFVATLIESAVEAGQREVRELGLVSGTLKLDAVSGQPQVTLTDVSALGAPAPETLHQGTTPRQLKVELDSASFPTAPTEPLLLTLPDTTGFRHLELGVRLKLAGAEEASVDQNDTLDVPLLPREAFKLQLVDELGEPISGATLEFALGDVVQKVATDANGNARADSLGKTSATLTLLEPESVRAELSQRWNQARAGIYLQPGPGVVVRPHTELAEPLTLFTAAAQVLSIRPVVKQARVKGLLFDTNKSFVVPEAIPEMRALKEMYDENPGAKLLVVGHTDTSGEPSVNDPLSFERAESVGAFLADDVDIWLSRYDSGSSSRRWGADEDLRMLSALTLSSNGSGVIDEALISLFQRTHNAVPEAQRSKHFAELVEDGKLGSETRRQLIADYMHRDETTLPEGIELTAHGCGENYPLDASGERLDSDAADAQTDALDRRVELFFFGPELGIQPSVPGKNSKPDSPEYPEWRRRATETRELEVRARGPLDFTTFAPSDVEPELVISDSAGAPVARLTREHGVQEDDMLRFSMLPEVLPAEVEFTVLRDARVDRQTGLFDAVALRDSLFLGDLDKAQDDLSGSSSATATSASLAKTTALAATPPASPATQQKLRILVRWDNPRHRFLRNQQPNLVPKDGASAKSQLPLASGSTPGRAGFDVPDDVTEFDITLVIKSSRATFVNLSQTYRVLRAAGKRPGLFPVTSNATPVQHPRLHSLSYTAGPPGTTAIEIMVDLLFLDVTKHVLGLPVADVDTTARFLRVQNERAASGIKSSFRVLEFTGGRPTTWCVILPPNLPVRLQHGVLLFLKNEATQRVNAAGVGVEGTYENSDDAHYTQALLPWWANPKNPGHYVNARGIVDEYLLFPPFGWDKKLRDSKKTPVVLFPIPHQADMGVLESPSDKTRSSLLRSALLCLFVDGQVKTGSSFPPVIRHLVVGAWSSGTSTLFKWVPVASTKGSKLVDEFWVFDGKRGFPVNFAAWFNADKSRRLRLLGTAYTEVASNVLGKQFKGEKNVFVHPGDPKYWYQSADYKRALSNGPGLAPLRFRKQPRDRKEPNDATVLTNILAIREAFVAKDTEVEQGLTLSTPGIATRQISPISNEEAATLIVLGHLLPNQLPPISTAVEFTAAVDRATTQSADEPVETFRHRHPWSVFGGLFDHQGRDFVGYFQLCLEESGL